MATANQRRQGQINHPFLPDEPVGDGRAGMGQLFAQGFNLTHQIRTCVHDNPFAVAMFCGVTIPMQAQGKTPMTKTTRDEAKISADGLAAAVRAVRSKGPPPVHLWNPAFCGDIDMRIARDGTWFYLGTPIGRIELVKLFAGIIKREGDSYFLVTPIEKVGITVDDAPFVAVDFDQTPAGLEFTTNVGDRATAGPDHAIRVTRDPATGAPRPYIQIRSNLEALIDRKSFYRLVEIGEHQGDWFGIRSGGTFFPMIPSAEL